MLYIATCPACGSVVYAATDRVPLGELVEELDRLVADGLTIELAADTAVKQLQRHMPGCSLPALAKE